MHTYIHTHIHTYIHTYIQTYRHTYIHTYIHSHAYMHTCIHAYVHTCIRAYVHTCIHAYMHTCIHAYMHTCIHAYTYNIHIFDDVLWQVNMSSLTQETEREELVSIFRHMTDKECSFLREHGTLPDTQPYQTIVEGDEGFQYCKKFLDRFNIFSASVFDLVSSSP